jgi:hypothetical protein
MTFKLPELPPHVKHANLPTRARTIGEMLLNGERIASGADASLLFLLADEIDRLRAENEKLLRVRAAADRVCWFDWSENDEDAVRAVAELRTALASAEKGER